jgi:AcrR family transcriptional regulator
VSELGLRERKKLEMRERLSAVALRLFDEHGFDHVRVADIAVAANVSEKTVYNYYATKEDLLLGGWEMVEVELLGAIRERAPGVPVLDVVREHSLAVAERVGQTPAAERAAFHRIVGSAPAIHMRALGISFRYKAEIGALLAEETGAAADDPVPYFVAGVIDLVTHLAWGVGWSDIESRSTEAVQAGVLAVLAQAERGLEGYGAKGAAT